MSTPELQAFLDALPTVVGQHLELSWRGADNAEHRAVVVFGEDGDLSVLSYERWFHASVCPVCDTRVAPGDRVVERHIGRHHPGVLPDGHTSILHVAGDCSVCDDIRTRLGGDLAKEVAERLRCMAQCSQQILDKPAPHDIPPAVYESSRRYAQEIIGRFERARKASARGMACTGPTPRGEP